MEQVNSEIKHIKKLVKERLNKDITNETAFEFLAMQLFCYKTDNIETKLYDIDSSITNGANDGGIDFVYFDDDNSKVVLGQCKLSKNIDYTDVISELNKMSTTLDNFKKCNTGMYNNKLKTELQNALDQLPDFDEGNVEYCIFVSCDFDEVKLFNKINNEQNIYSKEMVSVYTLDTFNSQIKELNERNKTIPEFKIKIDKPKNYLQYSTDLVSGIMVNMSSNSLIQMYNKYKDEGLFDMNIRKYVKNKIVDEGIEKTLDKERSNFWFYNNGLIIACEDFDVDGYNIKLEGFSIVNGGQTTNRIGNYKGKNTEEFFIPCKIIKVNKSNPALFGKIAETTNSQKPIYPRDLKANSPEMKILQKWLENEDVYLEIKRGEKKKTKKYKIKNDELGQLILSFAYQQPGTARSGKKSIFDNQNLYNRIYKQNYEKDPHKKGFILDLIKLSYDYSLIEEELKNGTDISENQKIILKNARCVVLALFGVTYMLENGDIDLSDLINNPDVLTTTNFTYGKFISNYTKDDYEEQITDLTKLILEVLDGIYENAIEQNTITSVSNMFKTDKKYRETIVKKFANMLNKTVYRKQFEPCKVIFKRN